MALKYCPGGTDTYSHLPVFVTSDVQCDSLSMSTGSWVVAQAAGGTGTICSQTGTRGCHVPPVRTWWGAAFSSFHFLLLKTHQCGVHGGSFDRDRRHLSKCFAVLKMHIK